MKPTKRRLALDSVYGLLETGPVVLPTTASAGRPNVMPMSWHMMMEFTPPLVGCIVSSRNYSFAALTATRECVINIPTVALIRDNLFVLQVRQAWRAARPKRLQTFHHMGMGRFMIAGHTRVLPSKMK